MIITYKSKICSCEIICGNDLITSCDYYVYVGRRIVIVLKTFLNFLYSKTPLFCCSPLVKLFFNESATIYFIRNSKWPLFFTITVDIRGELSGRFVIRNLEIIRRGKASASNKFKI